MEGPCFRNNRNKQHSFAVPVCLFVRFDDPTRPQQHQDQPPPPPQKMVDDRRARLKALAARAGRTKESAPDRGASSASAGANNSNGNDPPRISFRNYAPTDGSLAGGSSGGAGPSASKRQRTGQEPAAAPRAAASSSEALKSALSEAREEAAVGHGGSNSNSSANTHAAAGATVTSLAPKKINWDLKRDLSDKLAKLERRTQKAIVEILKERLESEAAEAVDEDGDSDLD
ncbi:unnamed protein product [Pseudo-nitzschia multistriata]|uniref:Coiled-coil domain-containing protein 12 n=1 Tax=Pseudo-nitzschia multistriata TaxID=183589 RepID=A0A448YX04_9STRA|nr:unnamed protein product [Pseudo-nitzschia multistriata]